MIAASEMNTGARCPQHEAPWKATQSNRKPLKVAKSGPAMRVTGLWQHVAHCWRPATVHVTVVVARCPCGTAPLPARAELDTVITRSIAAGGARCGAAPALGARAGAPSCLLYTSPSPRD